MRKVSIDLHKDWLDTVREIYRGAGKPFAPEATAEEIGTTYFLASASGDEEATRMRIENEQWLRELESRIMDNLDAVIIPDIRQRTGYQGEHFRFRWVYQQGEHIVEECSNYRIPLTP
ncbi:hypothetical protein [Cohnella thailandensis]|uniref:Uncharacterized protein n=1 Tax=Cohnella thailandensis TaxID=557557 RepID=A0A841T4W6_9BACL|nr:hypothetical protein [Cohnella thailandensis]MBB6636897.1 hypothetical protein [Cohnella thailandensis]MBP1973224.1 hypothetical protein [Cohnella thailandensis]